MDVLNKAISDLVDGTLAFIGALVSPDWGALVGLLPLAVGVVTLLFLLRFAQVWMRPSRPEPRDPARRIPRRSGPWSYLRGFIVGIPLIAAGLMALPPAGADGIRPVANYLLLLPGLAVAIGSVALGIRAWERGDDEHEPDGIDHFVALVERNRGRFNRIVMFAVGVLITAAGILIVPGPDATTGIRPAATVVLLIVGLVLAISAAGSAIAAWDKNEDEPGLGQAAH